MLNLLIRFSLKNRAIVLALAAFLVAWGILVVKDAPIDAFPDLSENQVLVAADWMGRGPQEIQDQVTYPLETALRGLPNVKQVRSASSFGMSLITVIFEDGVEPYFARQVVNEKLQEAIPRLPVGVQPTLGPVSTPMGQVFMYTLESNRHNLADLRTTQDFTIKQQLSAVPGVAEVASIGGYVMQYQVNLNPHLLQNYRVNINQVFGALQANNSNLGAKVVEQNGQEYIIRGLGLIESIEDIKNIVITQNNNIPVYIGNVANVTTGPDFRRGALTKSGYEAAGGIVIQRMGVNTLDVIRQVKEKIAEVQPTLPDGMRIVPFYDQTELVQRAVATLTDTILQEIVLVLLIVVLSLGHLRSSLIVSVTVPLGIFIAFIVMKQINLSANLMSLGGIALGIGVMVDAGSVMVENIFRHLAEDGGKRDIVEVALIAGEEVGAPIFFSVLIIIVTFMPMFVLAGTEGKMYTPLAWANASAMAGSLILALTIVPVLCTFLLKGKIKQQKTFVITILQKIYRPILQLTLKIRWAIIFLSAAAMIGALLLVPFLRTAFMPSLNEGTFLVMPTMLPSVSLTEALEAAKAMDRLIMEVPEIDLSVSKVGRAETAMDPAPINMIETIVTLRPKEEWRSGLTQEDIEHQMMEKLSYLSGLNLAFTQPIAGRLAMLTTGIRTDLGLKLYGEDIGVLQQKAFDIEQALSGVAGISDLLAERIFGASYLEIQVNRGKLARYGLNIADVENAIELAIGGQVATTTIEGRRRFDVLVRYNRGNREDIDAMRSILIPVTAGQSATGGTETGGGARDGMGGMGNDGAMARSGGMGDGMGAMGGGAMSAQISQSSSPQTGGEITDGMAAAVPGMAYVPLVETAQFQIVEGPSMISNEDGIPLITIQMNSRGRDIVSFVDEANRIIRQKVELPPGYSLRWTGQYENQQRAKERLTLVIPIVIATMFFLMYMAFNSFSDAVLVLMNIPFSLVGGIVALYFTETYMTLAAAVGFIAVGGIAVENGVLMVSCFKHLREKDNRSLKDAVVEGALSRLRPVLITAGTTLGGTLSLLFATGAGAEMQRPIATVIVGGLTTSTILTLIVLPCIYLTWYRRSEKRRTESVSQLAPDN